MAFESTDYYHDPLWILCITDIQCQAPYFLNMVAQNDSAHTQTQDEFASCRN